MSSTPNAPPQPPTTPIPPNSPPPSDHPPLGTLSIQAAYSLVSSHAKLHFPLPMQWRNASPQKKSILIQPYLLPFNKKMPGVDGIVKQERALRGIEIPMLREKFREQGPAYVQVHRVRCSARIDSGLQAARDDEPLSCSNGLDIPSYAGSGRDGSRELRPAKCGAHTPFPDRSYAATDTINLFLRFQW